MAAIVFESRTTVRDPDLWWHLKVGDWIVEHHAVPYVGIFSRTAGAHPWIAYSWGYEVLLSRAYAWFGLVGLAMFGVLLTVAVTFVLFWMLHRLCGRFWIAWILALIGSLAFLFSLMPRPVFVTMILFTIVLTFLLEAQRSGRMQLLWWLPVIFVLWANIHIQFVYGLAVVGLFMGVNLLQRLPSWVGIRFDFLQPPTLPLSGLIGILLACFAATFIGPYTYHLYHVVAAYSNSHVPYFMIQELSAFDFKFFTHYALLLLTAGAFFAVGWPKKLDLFKLSLLVVASVVAFRTERDAWFLGICAAMFVADIAGPRAGESAHTPALKLPELAGAGAVLAMLLWLTARNTGFNTRDLDRDVSREYPVDAVNFVRRNSFSGPLYNHLDWGGFLIWYLPQYPVVVDGRNDLYGDELDLITYKSSQGDSYTSDPYLNEAGLVLLPQKLPLAKLLTIDSRFRLVYQDPLSVVFVRK
ncbi:MAG: hypothetical protein ACLPVW_11365 [Terriglobales bacterium]